MKIGITGTHGTGKSTAVFSLAEKLKIENPTKSVGIVLETACQSPLPINKDAPLESQLWIFCKQMEDEIVYSTRYDIVVCDRTVFDSIPYNMYLGRIKESDAMLQLCKSFANSYDEIIFKTIQKNDYLFSDGIRETKDIEYRKFIEGGLIRIFVKELDFTIKGENDNVYYSPSYKFKLTVD